MEREKEIPEYKIKLVKSIADKIKKSRTTLIASTKGLPSSQYHDIKKKFRGKAEITVVKKSIVLKAIESSGKEGIEKIKEIIGSDVALFFSDLDAFDLSGQLSDNQSSTRAKAGDIAPEDINIEPGPTDLIPGPAISELSSVGLKVAVENGKLAIKLPHTIVKAGTQISENVASVLGKLNITPMKVGFEPIGAYDSNEKKVFVGIKIDKAGTLEELRKDISLAVGFAVRLEYPTKETVSYFIKIAGNEEKAIENITGKNIQNDDKEVK